MKRRGGAKITEQLFGITQAPHGTDWPVTKLVQKNTGNFWDIVSRSLKSNFHKIDYGIDSALKYEMLYLRGLTNPYFKGLVWLGEQIPVDFNPENKKKKEVTMIEEKKSLAEIHADEKYKSEVKDWILWYHHNIVTPKVGETPLVSEDGEVGDPKTLIDYVNDNLTNPTTAETKPLFDIAKLARISWFKNNKINNGTMFKVGEPITVTKIERDERGRVKPLKTK
jgi:hypothetical protein